MNTTHPQIFVRFIVPIFGAIAAILVSSRIAGSEANSLSAAMTFLAAIGFIVGLISPRMGLYLLVLLSASLDILKRVLIFFGNFSWNDLVNILSVSPVTTAGVYVGFMIAVGLHRVRLRTRDWVLLGIMIIIEIIVGLIALKNSGGMMEALKEIANIGTYLPLLLVAGHVLKKREEVERLLRFAVYVFSLVAAYGIWQAIYGLASFEIDYLRSGYTITASILDDVRIRPFSTLSSPHAYSLMMLFMLTICIYFVQTKKGTRSIWILFYILFQIAILTSTVRSAAIYSVLLPVACIMFRSGLGTIIFYCFSLFALAWCVANARFLMDIMGTAQALLPMNSAWQEQTFRLGTFSDRLIGFQNVLMRPETWTLFGDPSYTRTNIKSANDTQFTHDLLSETLLRFGAVPTAIVLFAIAACLFIAHKILLKKSHSAGFPLSIALLSILAIFFMSNMFGGSFQVFPANIYFWLYAGIIYFLLFLSSEDSKPTRSSSMIQ